MGSASIVLSKCTWYQLNDSTNHYNAEWLKICREYSGGSTPYYAVMQFSIPSALKYKKINKVYVRYYSRWTYWSDARLSGMKVAPYVCDGEALNYLTGATVDSYGVRGEWITVEPFSDFADPFPKWRSSDVTSIFSSNLYNDTYFTLIFSGYPGIPSYDAYGEIAGWAIDYLPTLEIQYEDVDQLPPDPSYPVGAYVNENTDLLFSWSWRAETKAVQAAVQLEYKLATAQSWTVVSLTQTTHTYTLSGGLTPGAYQWRIKGTNDAGETSAYSDVAEFTVIGQPTAPVINTPANKALTEISWSADDQNSYDITLTDSNSVVLINETIASSVSSYKPQMLLKGSYTVGIRYRNSSGLSSTWAYKTFTINASGPSTPAMTLYGDYGSVKITISPENMTEYLLSRAEDDGKNNYKIIGKFSDVSYIDKTLKFNTSYIYKVSAYATAQNIFDKSGAVSGKYVNCVNGNYRDNAGYYATGFVSITPGEKYTLTSFDQLAFYDSNKTYIGGLTIYQGTIYTYGSLTNVDAWTTYTDFEEPLTFIPQTEFAYINASIASAKYDNYKIYLYGATGYTDSNVARHTCLSEAISLQTSELELFLSKSENEFLSYAEDSKTEMAVFRCPGRRYPVVEHSEVDSWIFSSSLFVTEAEKDTLKEMAKEDYIWYRDYSGRAFPVAIQTLAFNRYMKEGYTANIEFVRIAEREVVINV